MEIMLETKDPVFRLKPTDHKNAYQHAKNIMQEESWPELGSALARSYLDLRAQLSERDVQLAELHDAIMKMTLKASSYWGSIPDDQTNPRGINRALEYIIDTGNATRQPTQDKGGSNCEQ